MTTQKYEERINDLIDLINRETIYEAFLWKTKSATAFSIYVEEYISGEPHTADYESDTLHGDDTSDKAYEWEIHALEVYYYWGLREQTHTCVWRDLPA